MMPEVRHLTLICQWPPCSKPFEVHVIRLRDTLRKFCSRRCSLRYGMPLRDTGTLADHFWAKVIQGTPNECWPWQGGKAGKGYGTLYVLKQRRLVGAHVVSWFLHHGAWPPAGMNVLHNCPDGDNPACVNPAHLWLGTQHDNMVDKVAKGRDNVTWNKITKAEAQELCALYATGTWTYKQLAKKYGLAERTPYVILQKHGYPANLPGTEARRLHAARGERNGSAKLTDAQWQEALALYATGEWSSRQLAIRYSVNKSSILRRLKRQH